MMVPFIVILPGLLGWVCYREAGSGIGGHGHRGHSYNDVLPLMLARYCGRVTRAGSYGAHCRIHVGHGRQC